MLYNFKYDTIEERDLIIEQNKSFSLVGQKNISEGNFLTFTDDANEIYVPLDAIVKEQGDKITNLEAENKTLKEELTITQDAINELILLSMSL